MKKDKTVFDKRIKDWVGKNLANLTYYSLFEINKFIYEAEEDIKHRQKQIKEMKLHKKKLSEELKINIMMFGGV